MNAAWKENWKFLKWCLAGIAFIGVLFALMLFSGCVPVRQLIDYAHEVPVACDILLDDENVQGESRELAQAMKDTGQALADKSGPPSVEVNRGNVGKRLEQTKKEAEEFVPWYQGLLGGLPLGGGEAGILGLILAYFFRNKIRPMLHPLFHNPKEGSNETG